MDEEQTSESLEAKIRELEEDIEEIHELLEKPEDEVVQILELERGERQVIVHWIELPEATTVTDLAEAEEAFKYADPVNDPYANGGSGRAIGHGDLMVMDTGECRYIAYVVNVDRVDPDYSGIQAEAPTDNHAVSVPDSVARGDGKPKKDLIVWSTCTGEGGGDPCSHAHPTESVTVPIIEPGTISVPTVETLDVVDLFKQTSNTQVSLIRDYSLTTTSTTINVSASGTTLVPVSIHADEYQISIFNDDSEKHYQYLVNDITWDEDSVRLPTDDQTVSIGTSFAGVTSDTQTMAEDNFFRVSQPNTIPLKAIQVSLCSGGQSTSVTLFALATGNDTVAGHLMANKDGAGAVNGAVTGEIIVPKFDVSIWSTDTVSIAKNWSPQTVTRNLDVEWDNNAKAVISLGTRSPFDVLKNLRATAWTDVVDSVTGSATIDLPTGITPDNSSKVIINNRVGTTEIASKVNIDTSNTEAVIVQNGTKQAAGAAEPCVSVYNPT